MIAKITSARLTTTGPFTGLYLYGWKQLIPKLKVGGYEDPASARFGTVTSDTVYFSPALEINNTLVAVDTIVFMQPRGFTLDEPCFEFQYTPPGGGSTPVSAWKTPAVRAATVAALPANTYANGSSGVGATLTGNSNAALSAQDGVTLSVSQDLLVKTESSASHNGIYTLTQVGDGSHPYILTRRTDCDEAADVLAATVTVEEGTVNADTVWLCTADNTITIGTTALPWARTNMAGLGTDTHIAIWDGTNKAAVKDSNALITNSTSGTKAATLRVQAANEATPGDHVIVDLFSDNAHDEAALHLREITGSATGAAGAGYDIVSVLSYFGATIDSQRLEFRYILSLTSTVTLICRFYAPGDTGTPFSVDNVWDFSGLSIGANCYVAAHAFIGPSGAVGQTGTISPGATADGGVINSLGAAGFSGTGTIVFGGVTKTMTVVNGFITSIT